MRVQTQTRILSMLILLLIVLVLILSVMCSGMLDRNAETEPRLTAEGHEVNDELEPAIFLYAKVNENWVTCKYTGNQTAEVSWSFGDGVGAINKAEVVHKYPDSTEDKFYLISMYVVEDFGRSYTENTYVEIKANTLIHVQIPETSQGFRLYTSTLLMGGIASLFFAITMFWIDIPPEAFTQKLRVIVGISFILCYMISIGFFNNMIFGG